MKTLWTVTTLLLFFAATMASAATLKIENVTRIKGQEVTMLRGPGIVTGLNGTGDDMKSFGPTARTMIRMLELSGLPGATLREMGSARNCALVEVTVMIPETGGRDGDRLDCTVSTVGNAKSLEGGNLTASFLTDPFPKNSELAEALGMASGKITLEDDAMPTNGKIKRGCRLTGDFINPYIKDGNVTLVIRQEYSDPRMALYVENAINGSTLFGIPPTDSRNRSTVSSNRPPIAKAINSHFVLVTMPKEYFNEPMKFVAALMELEITVTTPLKPRVVINEKAGIITIDEGVEVTPSLITHRLITAEIRPPVPAGQPEVFPNQFIDIDTETRYAQQQGQVVENQKLRALQASLDALRVPPQDVIDIIKMLERQGAIIGDVIYVDAE